MLIAILLSSLTSAEVMINEIMYDVVGSDSGHEWVEIYSNQSIDLTGWKFYENSVNHNLNLINGSIILDGYAIIADNSNTFISDNPDYDGTLFDSAFS